LSTTTHVLVAVTLENYLNVNNIDFSVEEFLDTYYKLDCVKLINTKIDYKFANNNNQTIIVDSKFIGETLIFTFIKK